MRVGSHRLGDEIIFCMGSIPVISKPTLGEMIMGETCASTSVGLVRIIHEQGISCIVEAIF